MSEYDGKFLIGKIVKRTTPKGRQVVDCFATGEHIGYQYPVLTIADMSLLLSVDVDPADFDQEKTVLFWAYYVESEKLNTKGNPYKNVLYLTLPDGVAGSQAAGSVDLAPVLAELAEVKGELKALKALMLQLVESIQAEPEPGHVAQVFDVPQDEPAQAAMTHPEPMPTTPQDMVAEVNKRTNNYYENPYHMHKALKIPWPLASQVSAWIDIYVKAMAHAGHEIDSADVYFPRPDSQSGHISTVSNDSGLISFIEHEKLQLPPDFKGVPELEHRPTLEEIDF